MDVGLLVLAELDAVLLQRRVHEPEELQRLWSIGETKRGVSADFILILFLRARTMWIESWHTERTNFSMGATVGSTDGSAMIMCANCGR